ncbi:ABC transporter ATP-binding protein [Saccharopolyspora rectivirgula]|jgi:ABC-2 type transport system ATP-binding protein|uniref:ABC transporter ATP-binding protein n=1 Tax=Saccharopolyspora rectivirgula TaxID=28042 RepID=A0A073B3W9_9PSEU|nr:ABC transporter ATP-binding protein [Saccharopolyspora rectivirgula]KEI45987.1 ABC transporter ATP-binding protein [Saccharopolyspora rectivirgula]
MIEAISLTKRYGRKTAVEELSFTVQPGVVTGFLGPNGSGKSTTMRMILGLDHPTSGEARIAGKRYRELKHPLRTVGALLDAKWVHPNRTAWNHLHWMARSNRIPRRRVDEVLALTGLEGVADRKAGQFSLGMAQRLGIAAALLGDPEVLLFDEPVNGLDPEGIHWLRQLLKNLAASGRTVFVSSHLLSEMAQTADQLVVIGRGKLLTQCSTEQFVSAAAPQSVLVRTPDAELLQRVAAAEGLPAQVGRSGELLFREATGERIGELAAQHGIRLHELTPQRGSLEEAFMRFTGNAVEYQASALTGAGVAE